MTKNARKTETGAETPGETLHRGFTELQIAICTIDKLAARYVPASVRHSLLDLVRDLEQSAARCEAIEGDLRIATSSERSALDIAVSVAVFDKERFKDAAMSALRSLARALGEVPRRARALGERASRTCDVSWNAGGIAVSGEAVLHTTKVYVHVSKQFDPGPLAGGERGGGRVWWRTCKGRKDFTGGRNQHSSIAELEDGRLASKINACLADPAWMKANVSNW